MQYQHVMQLQICITCLDRFVFFIKRYSPRSIWLMSLCNYEFAFFVLLVLYFFIKRYPPRSIWLWGFAIIFGKEKQGVVFAIVFVTIFFMGIINILYNNCYVSRRLEMKVKMTHSNEMCFVLIRLAKSHPFLWNVNLHKRLVFSCFYHSLNECVAQQVR